MHNYYPLVARAVSRLESNTPVARDALFEKLRVILIDQLRIRQRPASSSEIMRERAALEVAIRKVESEAPIPSKSSLGLGSAQTPGSKPIFSGDPVRVPGQRAEANGPPREPTTISEGQHPNLDSTTTAGHPATHEGFAAAKQRVIRSIDTPQVPPPVRVPGHRAEANGSPLEPIKISEGQHPNLEFDHDGRPPSLSSRFCGRETTSQLRSIDTPKSRLDWARHKRLEESPSSAATRYGFQGSVRRQMVHRANR